MGDDTVHDVVIVGAGLSGLAAARELLRHDAAMSVVVLEARDRVGGRTCSETTTHGCRADVGGAYVGPTQDYILNLAAEMGIDTYTVPDGTIAFINNQNPAAPTVKRGSGDRPPFGVIELLDFNYAIYRMEREAAQLSAEAPWDDAQASTLDRMSAADWIAGVAATERVRHDFSAVVETVLCKPASEVSALYWLWYNRAGDNARRHMDARNGAQERKFHGGSAKISEELAARLPAGALRLSHEVARVEQDAEHVVVTCKSGAKVVARRAIMAAPLPLLRHMSFSPPLPEAKMALVEGCSFGSIIKTVTYYDRPFWRDAGITGQLFDPGPPDGASPAGPVLYCMDDTKPDGSFPAIMGFILADRAREWSARPEPERRAAVAKQYALAFGSDEGLAPAAYIEKDWNKEAFTGGCYVAVTHEGVLAEHGAALREPFARVHFAGTETASVWPGYMDGAVQAGARAAAEITKAALETPPRALPHTSNAQSLVERGLAVVFGGIAPLLREPRRADAPRGMRPTPQSTN